jgi:HAMP domain-containing protein
MADDTSYSQESIVRELDAYKKNFESVIAKDQEISLLIDATRYNIDEVQNSLKELVLHIGEKNKKIISDAIRLLVALIIILIVFVVLILFFISKTITNPIAKIQELITELSKGKLPERIELTSKDEIATMANSLNSFIDGMHEKSSFAGQIGKGRLNTTFNPISEDDTLGLALLEMRDSLKKADDEEKRRKIEDEKVNWATIGVAKFNDIIHKSEDDIKELSYLLISNLVKYLEANQSGLFILNNEKKDDIHLQLIASYAYNRRKHKTTKIHLKEGLVGQCAVEKKTIFLTKIPEDYIAITSGLGEATPNCLLIVPLLLNEVIFGVLEIATLNELKKYEIEFVEKLAETFAATLSSLKINARTAYLLNESRKHGEEMASREEELRQNYMLHKRSCVNIRKSLN